MNCDYTFYYKSQYEKKSWDYYLNIELNDRFSIDKQLLDRTDLVIESDHCIILVQFSYTCKFEYDKIIKQKKRICKKYFDPDYYTKLYFILGIYADDENNEKKNAIDCFIKHIRKTSGTLGMFADKEMLKYLLDYDFDVAFQYNSRVDLTILAEKIRTALKENNHEIVKKLFSQACFEGLGYDENCESIYITLSFVNDDKYMIIKDNIYNEHKNEKFGESQTLYIWNKKTLAQWRKDDMDNKKSCKKIRNDSSPMNCFYEKHEVDPSFKKMFKMLVYLSCYHLNNPNSTGHYFLHNYSAFETFFVQFRDLSIKNISYSKNQDNSMDRFIQNHILFDPHLLNMINNYIKDTKTAIQKLGYIIRNNYQTEVDNKKRLFSFNNNHSSISMIDEMFRVINYLVLDKYIYIGDDVKFFFNTEKVEVTIFPGLHSAILFDINIPLIIRSYYNVYKSLSINESTIRTYLENAINSVLGYVDDEYIDKFFQDGMNEESKSILQQNIPLFYIHYYSPQDYEKVFHVKPPNQQEIQEILNPNNEDKRLSLLYKEYIEKITHLVENKDIFFSGEMPESFEFIEWSDDFFFEQINQNTLPFFE